MTKWGRHQMRCDRRERDRERQRKMCDMNDILHLCANIFTPRLKFSFSVLVVKSITYHCWAAGALLTFLRILHPLE